MANMDSVRFVCVLGERHSRVRGGGLGNREEIRYMAASSRGYIGLGSLVRVA